MTEKVFIDSNIFVYAYTGDDKQKHSIARDLLRNNVLNNEIILSVQAVETGHLLKALFEESEDVVSFLLKKMNVNVNRVSTVVNRVEQKNLKKYLHLLKIRYLCAFKNFYII
jgi:predicted nucleic acid-binding protein